MTPRTRRALSSVFAATLVLTVVMALIFAQVFFTPASAAVSRKSTIVLSVDDPYPTPYTQPADVEFCKILKTFTSATDSTCTFEGSILPGGTMAFTENAGSTWYYLVYAAEINGFPGGCMQTAELFFPKAGTTAYVIVGLDC
jgi:hypothetical protein